MTQVLFDTQSAVDDLKRSGFTDDQAKANVRFVREALEGGVATKADIEKLEVAMNVQFTLSNTKAAALDNTLRSELGALRSEIKAAQFRVLAALAGVTGIVGLFIRVLS